MSLEINLIEGERGKLHVTSDDARTENAVIFGRGRKVLNMDEMFDAVLVGNNTVRILSGVLYSNGMFIRIDREDYKEVTIENGLGGTFRNDLICIRYERNIQTHIEAAYLVVKKGTASENTATDPSYITGDILEFASVDEFPLYRVHLDGIHPTLEPMFEVADAMDNITLYGKLLNQEQVDILMQQELAAHQQNYMNPHNVTAAHLHLENVDNTADINKIVSNPQKEYIQGVEESLEKDISDVAAVTEMALGKISTHLSDNNNPHQVTKEQVGLGNLDNTADKDKTVKYANSAGSADKLSNAVKINGVDFDGSKDIEIGDSERNMITSTATGEHITVGNSTGASVREFKVDGRTEQVTTTGKNLLTPLTTEVTTNGIKFTTNEDGSMSFSGTATANAERRITNDVPLPAGSYIMSNQKYDTSKYLYQIKITRNDGNAVWLDYSKGDCNFTINDGDKINYTSVVVKAGVTVNETIYPMIRKAEITDDTYEPYTNGASPNPDYPQDIKGVGNNGEVEVTVTGKNMLPTINEDTEIIDVHSTAPTIKENSITGGWRYALKGMEKYTGCIFSVKMRHSDTTTVSRPVFLFRNANETITQYVFNYAQVNTGYYQMEIPEGADRVWIDYAKLAPTAELYDFQIEKGEATEYEPYKSKTVSILMTDVLYEGDYIRLKNGKLEVYRKHGIAVFNGFENWEVADNVFRILNFAEGKDIKQTVRTNRFKSYKVNSWATMPDRYCMNYSNAIGFKHSECTTLQEWTTWLHQNPVRVVYELKEPTTEIIEIDIDLSTYNHVTNITNSDDANMEVEYFVNSANGEVVADLQEETKRLDNEKVDISLLKDYVKKIQMQINKISVPAHTSINYDYLIDEHDYTPILANVSVINTTDSNPVVCLKSCFDVSMTHAEFQLHNMSDSICDADVLLEVIYVKNI